MGPGIFSKMLLGFLLVALIPLSIFWGLQHRQIEAAERLHAETNLQMISQRLIQQVDDWTTMNLRVLQTAAGIPDLTSMNPQRQQVVVDTVARALPWAYLIHSLDAHGMNVVRSDAQAPRSYAFRRYYQSVRDGAAFAAEVQVGLTSGLPAFLMSVPIRDDAGQFLGVLAEAATLDEVTQAVSNVRFGQTGFAMLATPAGQLIAHPHEELGNQLLDYTHHPAFVEAQKPAGGVFRYRQQGREYMAVAGRTALGWLAIVQQEADESLAGVRAANRTGRSLLIITGLIVIALSLLVARGFSRPINQITELASAIARGELRSVEDSQRRDQIGDMQRAIAAMTASLRQSIHEIELNRSLLHASLENLPQGVSVIDSDLRLLAWNRPYQQLFGYPEELMKTGTPVADLLHWNAAQGLLDAAAVARRLDNLRKGSAYSHERDLPDGRTLQIRGNPISDAAYLTTYSDVTAYKTTERRLRALTDTLERRVHERTAALEQASAEARRANLAKSRFLAAAIHDLKQPISATRMYVSLLHQQLQDPACRELATGADSALHSIEGVFAGLMDLARFESGRLKPRIEAIELRAMFETLQREFGPLARQRGLKLRFARTSAWVRSDPTLLYRIVQNLISNALRYTAHGGVLVGIRPLAAGPGQLRIEVWDTGPGIPTHRQEEIFEEFRRLDTPSVHDEQGTGLGLAIVRNIALALQHRVSVRSRPDHGSVFALDLPLHAAGASAQATAAIAPAPDLVGCFSGLRVWCVDDHPQVRRSTVAALNAWACEVRDFADAADLRAAAAQDRPPELLLMDFRIGDDNGLQLLYELDRLWQRRVPALIITGEPPDSLPTQDRAPILFKPLDADALHQAISARLEDAGLRG